MTTPITGLYTLSAHIALIPINRGRVYPKEIVRIMLAHSGEAVALRTVSISRSQLRIWFQLGMVRDANILGSHREILSFRKILVDVFSIEETHKNESVVFKCEADAVIAELQPEVTLRAF
jgi:hypothetical protein